MPSPPEGDSVEVRLTLNGQETSIRADPSERLLDTLRYSLGLTGTKEGCAEGECGACTVLMDGLPVNSCLIPVYQAQGRVVETVESIGADRLAALLESGATQCGACTPGVVVSACWLMQNRDLLETHAVRELMAGNLCRCTGYDGIIEGIESAMGAGHE